ncbi:hypothetical protein [Flavobacterium micromati]|nr:hypothetical protein [Flavobacterium micromati]
MKKAIVALTAILMFNCGPDQIECTLYTYTIRNESGKNITIKAYRINRPDIAPVITNLAIGEKLTKNYRSCPPSGNYNFTDFYADRNTRIIDSITVIYENSKFRGFREDCSDRNPLSFCDYSTEVTFTFTAQDYENAQDCNGKCN